MSKKKETKRDWILEIPEQKLEEFQAFADPRMAELARVLKAAARSMLEEKANELAREFIEREE